MGPKGKKKEKDKKKAKPEIPAIDPKEIVTELDKEFFEFQLSEIEKKLSRVDAKEEELRAGTLELEEKIEEYKKEKGRLISEQEQLLAMTEEMKIQKREEAMQLSEEVKTRAEKHMKHMEELEEKYNEMVQTLGEQLRALEEEVRDLEEYRANREYYGDLLLELELEIEEARMQHQRNLFYIEQKAVIATKRVKKELQSKLLQLSIEFRQTTQKKIGKASHRMTQENKAIENELKRMKDDVIEYQEMHAKARENANLFKEQHHRWLSVKDKGIAKIVIQVVLIKTLLNDRVKLLKKLGEYYPFEVQNKTLSRKLKVVTFEIEKVVKDIEDVMRNMEKINEETKEMSEASSHLKKTSRRLQVHVRNALKIAEEAKAVRLIPMGGMEEERYMTNDARISLFKNRRNSTFRRKGKILNYLFEFLSHGQLTDDDKKYIRRSSASFDIDTISFTQIFKKSGEREEGMEGSLSESEEEVGPYVGEGSELSLPRSVTPVITSSEQSESESIEGELEEFGERDEENQGSVVEKEELINFEEDLGVEQEDEEDEEKKSTGSAN